MSAWPQAVWIVENLQKNFDYEKELYDYTQNLNTLNIRINSTISNVNTLANEVEQAFGQKVVTEEGSSLPTGTFTEGTIFLLTE